MNKLLIITFLAACVAPLMATAQPVITQKEALKVELTVECETLTTGPYARYAQQYLGVVAPLNSRVDYKIVGATISKITPESKSVNIMQSAPEATFNDMSVEPIVGVASGYGVDRTSASEKSLQEMAVSASQTIFNLRKRRIEVITGDIQDSYGAGVGAAIDEIGRLENEYLSLFLGKKVTTNHTYTFSVLPSTDKNSYILCRFSNSAGVIDLLESSGEQLVLTVTSENSVKPISISAVSIPKDQPLATTQIVEEWVTAAIIFDGKIVANAMFELPQYGKVVTPTFLK